MNWKREIEQGSEGEDCKKRGGDEVKERCNVT